jgi:hypothetical protein
VYQYWKSNLTKKAESADYGGTIYALEQDSTYVYAGGATTKKVYQYWKSNLTKKAESADYGGIIYGLVQDNTYIYVGGATTKKVYQYWKSNLTKKAETADYGGIIYGLAQDSTYVYAGGDTTQKVYQYWTSNLTKKAESADYGGITYALVDELIYYNTGQTFSSNIESLTPGTLYHYQAYANNTLNGTGSDKTFLTKPNPPNTFSAQANSSSMIYLTWNKGTGANNTYIERNASGQTVWARGTGNLVYNGSATHYEDSGRNLETTYYYQAWSYTKWTTPPLHQYSDDNDSTSATIEISIDVTPSAWNQGTVLIGSSNATAGLYFNLTNQGNIPLTIQIKATNATNATTGAKWNLSASAAYNNFTLQFNKSGDVSWTTINLTYGTFVLNLPASGTDWKRFDLNLIMATSSSAGVSNLSLTITFKSVAA